MPTCEQKAAAIREDCSVKTAMLTDAITPHERLSRLSQNRWEHRLSLLFFVIALLLCLALMCENVNAAPQAKAMTGSVHTSAAGPAVAAPFMLASDMPPLKLDHPICPGGFWIAQRYDERNAAGTIIKSVWVRKCTKGRVIYGKRI